MQYALSIVAAIAVAVLAIVIYNYLRSLHVETVPGQYPINAQRPMYSGAIVKKAYSPSADMGSDELYLQNTMDAKMRCAISDTC